MTLKERFALVRAAFNGTPPTPPAPAPAPAPTPGAMAAKTYKLQDGVTEISISQAGDMPAVGDMVTLNGAPAPAGTMTLADGATITVDATGAITVYTAAAPPAPAPAPNPAPPQPVTLSEFTVEQVQAMYAKFITGTPEERLAGLEVMVKALMECNFGWKIREGQENQAIQVYKDTVATATPAAPTVSIEEMNSVFAKADEQAKVINKHEETIKLLMDLTEQLVEQPNAEPVTLTGGRKEKFEQQKKDQAARMERMAEALKKNRALA